MIKPHVSNYEQVNQSDHMDELKAYKDAVHPLGVEFDADFCNVDYESDRKGEKEGAHQHVESSTNVHCIWITRNRIFFYWLIGAFGSVALWIVSCVVGEHNNSNDKQEPVEDALYYVGFALPFGLQVLVFSLDLNGLKYFDLLNG